MQERYLRYEFRAFAQNFGLVEEKMRKLSKLDRFRESSEIYILSAENRDNNIKIRYNMLDIKVFVKKEKGLQQWNPRMKEEFPLKMEIIRDEIFPVLGVAIPEFKRVEYTLTQYLEDIVNPHSKLVLARVFKRRFGYIINGCASEIAELLINGAAIKTVALESANVEAALKAKEMLGLQGYENVNYLVAIKRILGMEPLPE
ncbi:hypothetical protein OAC89_01200 [Deltaproteobacteria bacterium]|nr:hypothetical protein [Deltaproteobacteria bacterium]